MRLLFFLLLALFSFKETFTPACFFGQRLVVNDTLIVNNTELKVYCLYDTRDTAHCIRGNHYPFDGGLRICDDGHITVHYGSTLFTIKANGIDAERKIDSSCTKPISATHFGGSRRLKDGKNGGVEIYYDLKKKYIKTAVGTIEVSPQQFHCDDTGNNPFRIESKGRSIYFKQGGNLEFFEYDGDNDNKKELYILNYFSCESRLEIYKVDKK